jgi:multiple antibiotic resistance protein
MYRCGAGLGKRKNRTEMDFGLYNLPAAAIETYLALFPIVNPLGGLPLFFTLTAGDRPEERRAVAWRTSFYVIGILVVFMFFGRFVLSFFGISLPVLKICGGLIVAHTAMMVTGESRISSSESADAAQKEDISFSPMAMPILAGPGSIGVVMGLAAQATDKPAYAGMVVGILGLGLTVALLLRLGEPLNKYLGPVGMGAINRIFGFLIFSVAGQLVWNGITQFKFAG